MKKAKILMYHSIGTAPCGQETGSSLYSISEEDFHSQVQLVALAEHRAPGKIILTFDDGFLNNYHVAFPALREFELKAYFFITINRVGRPGYMNWEKIRELHSAGMIIGSHGMTHIILDGQSDEDLEYEIKWSKKILEEKLGAAVDYFSVPRGFCNEKVTAKAKEAGYKAIFTSNISDSDGFKSGRIAVKSGWDLEYFKKVLKNGLPLKDRTREFIKSASKKMFGARNYDRLRTRILK